MKLLPATALVYATLVTAPLVSTARAQGSLNPPAGPPVASMKTLDQVEARKPIQSLSASAPYVITQPGSYYLTGNITVAAGDAITISTDDVTIDLNGFTIASTKAAPPAGAAVGISKDVSRVTVRNGSIVSGTTVGPDGTATLAGFQHGIGDSQHFLKQAIVSDVRVLGVASNGIYLDTLGVVDRCTASRCGKFGIVATEVLNSTAGDCSETAISADGLVVNSFGKAYSGWGVTCGGNITGSTGISVSGTGLNAGGNADNSYGVSTSGIGLVAFTANNSHGRSTSGAFGMQVTGTASFCRATRSGGTAMQAGIAVACTAQAGTISSPQKQLGTP